MKFKHDTMGKLRARVLYYYAMHMDNGTRLNRVTVTQETMARLLDLDRSECTMFSRAVLSMVYHLPDEICLEEEGCGFAVCLVEGEDERHSFCMDAVEKEVWGGISTIERSNE